MKAQQVKRFKLPRKKEYDDDSDHMIIDVDGGGYIDLSYGKVKVSDLKDLVNSIEE